MIGIYPPKEKIEQKLRNAIGMNKIRTSLVLVTPENAWNNYFSNERIYSNKKRNKMYRPDLSF